MGGEPVGIMMIYYCYATMLLYTEDGFFPPSVCLLLESVYKEKHMIAPRTLMSVELLFSIRIFHNTRRMKSMVHV